MAAFHDYRVAFSLWQIITLSNHDSEYSELLRTTLLLNVCLTRCVAICRAKLGLRLCDLQFSGFQMPKFFRMSMYPATIRSLGSAQYTSMSFGERAHGTGMSLRASPTVIETASWTR